VPNRLIAGVVAGAAGTLALNVTTYLDMLLRGRPASKLPARMAGRLADEAGISLDFEGDSPAEAEGGQAASPADNRREAVGALLGYANGLGIGLGYGVVRLLLPSPPLWLAGGILGSAAMAASDVPAARLGLTRPQDWTPADWAADVIPHAAYGLVTALTFELLREG